MSTGLSGGEWVTRGGIKVWTGPRPVDEPDRPIAGECQDCGATVHRRTKRCRPCFDAYRGAGNGHLRQSPPDVIDELMGTFEHNFAAITPPLKPLGFVCHCGCLLTHEGESCPSCLLWSILNAARASWAKATTYYRLENAA